MVMTAGLLFVNKAAFAQIPYSSMGVRGGYTIAASPESRDIFGSRNLEGYHMGLYSTVYLTKSLAIQPEFLFSRRSYKAGRGEYVYHGTEEVFPFYTDSYDYFDIPIFLRLNVLGGLHILAGPQFSSYLGSKERFIDYGGREYVQRYGGASFMDLSGMFGLAYEFREGLNIGVRYGYGLGRIQSITNFDSGNVPHQTQGMFTVGYTFGGRSTDREPYMDPYMFE